jgi:glutamine synthetase
VQQRIEPLSLISGNAYNQAWTLPRSLDAALKRLIECQEVTELLGAPSSTPFTRSKPRNWPPMTR